MNLSSLMVQTSPFNRDLSLSGSAVMGVQPERRGAVTDNLFLSNIKLRPDEFLGNMYKMTHNTYQIFPSGEMVVLG